MKVRIILGTVFVLILALAATTSGAFAAASAVFTLQTSKLNYEYGETIQMVLRGQNTSNENLNLAFSTACQADYLIDTGINPSVLCAQMLTEALIKAGETREWNMSYAPGSGSNPKLYPGEHIITAKLIGYPSSEASQSITVNYSASGEGAFCGGIAAFQCTSGLSCKMDGTFPDAGGYCYNANTPVPPNPMPTPVVTPPFSDVPQSHWAFVYIKLLADNNLISGYGNGTFGPDNLITRAELTKMTLKAAAITPTVTQGSFTDLADWQKGWVYTAKSRDIIQGYSSTLFKPDIPINRAEALKIILLGFGVNLSAIESAKSTISTLPVTDITSSDWFGGYVAYAINNKILSGYPDSTFKPGYLITRAEAAKIIANLWQKNA